MTKKQLTIQQKKAIKELFETVYLWGRAGLKVDQKSETYQSIIGEILGNKCNGTHKVGASYFRCYIVGCKHKHLLF